jgi:hypothetical protein
MTHTPTKEQDAAYLRNLADALGSGQANMNPFSLMAVIATLHRVADRLDGGMKP